MKIENNCDACGLFFFFTQSRRHRPSRPRVVRAFDSRSHAIGWPRKQTLLLNYVGITTIDEDVRQPKSSHTHTQSWCGLEGENIFAYRFPHALHHRRGLSCTAEWSSSCPEHRPGCGGSRKWQERAPEGETDRTHPTIVTDLHELVHRPAGWHRHRLFATSECRIPEKAVKQFDEI